MEVMRGDFAAHRLDAGDPDLARFVKALDFELFLPDLQAAGIRSVDDIKRMQIGELRKVGLTIGAARRMMAAAADM